MTMNYSTAIFLISDEVRAIRAVYEDEDEYRKKHGRAPERQTFKTINPGIEVSDLIVVPTNTRHKATVVRVVEVDFDLDVETGEDVKWVIDRIDPAEYEDVKAQEQTAIAKIKSSQVRRRRKELVDDLVADAEEDLRQLPIYSGSKGREQESK